MERSSTYTTYMVFFLLDLRCIERPWWGRRKKTYKMANEDGNRVRCTLPTWFFLLDLRRIERPWRGRRKKTYKMANEDGDRVRGIDP